MLAVRFLFFLPLDKGLLFVFLLDNWLLAVRETELQFPEWEPLPVKKKKKNRLWLTVLVLKVAQKDNHPVISLKENVMHIKHFHFSCFTSSRTVSQHYYLLLWVFLILVFSL